MKKYVVTGRKPERVFRFFEDLNAIPRGSHNEKAVSDFLLAFAKQRGLEAYQDSANNVFVRMPATPGMEDRPTVLLQGHMDMVCEKNADVSHDFEKDGIDMYTDGKYLRARGTTLGGDDGIADAMMMAIMDGELEKHPAMEFLITTCEEVGLDGAKAFDYSRVTAKRMINLDSENEDQVTVGCAGGVRTDLVLPVRQVNFRGVALRLSVRGLAGGHSGENINSGRANANKLMGRILAAAPDFRLISIDGGSKDNAIPRECTAVIAVPAFLEQAFLTDFIPNEEAAIRGELFPDDAGFILTAEPVTSPAKMWDKNSTLRVVSALAGVANGVLSMSRNVPGLVGYSRSLGVVRTEGDRVSLVFSARSATESQLDASEDELSALGALAGAEVSHYSRYPGWDFAENSPVRDTWLAAYKRLFGTEPKVTVIHAGLECGIISSHLPELDMISVGPDMKDIHSPDEALDLDSCERIFRVLEAVLAD